jgi:hypothetical protein
MKTCPVCGETFGDDLNFCDVDGTALARDPSSAAQAKNKLWSILGVALLLGALAISALSVIFLPKARVSSPAVVSSVPPPETPPATQPTSSDTASNSQPPSTNSEPEALLPTDAGAPELKKRETTPGRENGNLSKSAKAAALAAEESEKPNLEPQPAIAPSPSAKKAEAPPAKTVGDKHDTEPPRATAPTPTDPKTAGTKTADNSNSKKKDDDKDKKKGGFFKVFKKIFGKD